MKRRLFAALAASALVLAAGLPASAVAKSPTRQFTRLDVGRIDPKLSQALLSNRDVTVVLQLAAAPASARHGLSNAQRAAVASQLKASQASVASAATRVGAKVLGAYQYAYNGVKVRATGRSIAALAAIPGVVAVHGLRTYSIDNVESVPFIGAPQAWQDLGRTGAGETIAVIDTGIDYTHANFGGPGTKAAFDANDSTVVEPGSFPTAKVIAGYDFAGNDYDANGDLGSTTPSPDPDPLDCYGHGSHVSGTAAGFGVTADGATYGGGYDANTYTHDFAIGPGVAPEANLVALKVFGCEGSTNLVVDALDWVARYNVEHPGAAGIDVVNMSLGAPFGRDDNPDSVATNTLVESGVVVVASAGNEGPNAYITGSPAAATRAVSVAAEDTLATFPGAIVDFTDSGTADLTNASNQNAWPGLPVSGTLKVITDSSGAMSLGCTKADYGTLAPSTIVAVQRGVCAFVDKGAAAQAAGAIGILDVNRDDIADPNELPTFIGYNPELFDIPMVGLGRGAKAAVIAADGKALTIEDGGTLANPTYRRLASFSSGGPRNGDSAAKPDLTAPGSSIVSTLVGSGNKGTTMSGTSMASPHASGVAALVRQANPDWSPGQVKAAMMNTATVDASKLRSTNVRVAGAGLVQPRRAIDSAVLATTGDGTASLSYGYDPANAAWSETQDITLANTGGSGVGYTLASSSPFVSLSASSVTVPAHGSVVVHATASLSAAALAADPSTDVFINGAWGGVLSRSGAITATPTTSGAGIYSLRIPYVAVPRALSNVTAGPRSAYSVNQGIARATLPLTNSGIHSGNADTYAWGLSDPKDLPATATNDIRAVGLQVLPAEALTGTPDANDRGLVFAINTYGRWSSGSSNEFDVAIYGANKHKPDYYVVGFDYGALTTGSFNGAFASFVFDAAFNPLDVWVADAPANGSTVLLPLLASDIGQTVNNTRFTYGVTGFSVEDSALVDTVAGQAELSAFTPAVTTGEFVPVAPGGSGSIAVAVDKGKLAVAPVKGWMVVTMDDPNGESQADLVPIGTP